MSPAGGSAARPERAAPLEAVGLALLLLTAASGRVIAPRYVRTLIPTWMPHPRLLADLTGIVELVLAGALLHPATRRRAAVATTGLIGAYLTSHLDAALHATRHQPRWLERPAGIAVRLTANATYIAWAAHLAMAASPTDVPRRSNDE